MISAAAVVLAGTVASCLPAVLPGLHIYNVMGLAALFLYSLQGAGLAVRPDLYIPFMVGLVTGWSVLNTIPSVLFSAPDESAILAQMPGQKYLMAGSGFEGVLMVGAGGLTGIFLLVFIGGPLVPKILPVVRTVFNPHLHWILWVIITFMLMTEWPKKGHQGGSGLRKFFEAWSALSAGLFAFLLSGLLGFLLLVRSPVPAANAFQNIMPAFAGLFAVPWCLLNTFYGMTIPPQRVRSTLNLNGRLVLYGGFSGALGGGFAAFFPVVTGGLGGLLAGHASAQRDERVFMAAQGSSKTVYYTGSLLLFFVPGSSLIRGGGAWILQSLYVPGTQAGYLLALGSIALSGAVSFLLLPPLTRAALRLIRKIDYRILSAVSLAVITAVVWAFTGAAGLFVMAVSSGIGLIPVLFGSRRLNCLGILLLPVACNLSGIGESIASFLRLL